MRIVLQRVSHASVSVHGRPIAAIQRGILLMLAVHQKDTPAEAENLAQKCAELRIFSDAEGKMNLSAQEIRGEALVISQFTLYGDCRKGRRPNFMEAADPQKAQALYDYFLQSLRRHLCRVEAGLFGASMQVQLTNDGPVTLILEKCCSPDEAQPR